MSGHEESNGPDPFEIELGLSNELAEFGIDYNPRCALQLVETHASEIARATVTHEAAALMTSDVFLRDLSDSGHPAHYFAEPKEEVRGCKNLPASRPVVLKGLCARHGRGELKAAPHLDQLVGIATVRAASPSSHNSPPRHLATSPPMPP